MYVCTYYPNIASITQHYQFISSYVKCPPKWGGILGGQNFPREHVMPPISKSLVGINFLCCLSLHRTYKLGGWTEEFLPNRTQTRNLRYPTTWESTDGPDASFSSSHTTQMTVVLLPHIVHPSSCHECFLSFHKATMPSKRRGGQQKIILFLRRGGQVTVLAARRLSFVTPVTPQRARVAARRIWGLDPGNRLTANQQK